METSTLNKVLSLIDCVVYKMEGTCNECVFPLTQEEGKRVGICPTDTSLVYASGAGKLSCVKELIAAGADVNAGCECHGNGALMSATLDKHIDCIKKLIQAGADVNIRNKNGETALMKAGDAQYLNELIAAGADVNIEDKDGWTALMFAVHEGHVGCLKELIAAGADINKEDKDGRTALMYAASQGHVDCGRELINAGADVNIKDKFQQTALTLVAFEGNLAFLKMLVSADANVNTISMGGSSPLMMAAIGGHVDCGRELINAGADVNIKDKFQQTAVGFASIKENVAFLKMLMSKDANVNTVVNFPTSKENVALLKMIISEYANANPENIDETSVLIPGTNKKPDIYNLIVNILSLMTAQHNESEKMVSDAGVDQAAFLSAEDKFANMVQSCISISGIDLPDQLLDTNLEKKNLDMKKMTDILKTGFSPLMIASLLGHTDCAKELIHAEANLNCKNVGTALSLAVGIRNLDLVKELIAAGANVTYGDSNKENVGRTDLMIAAHFGHAQCLKELISAGADVNIQTEDGHTAISFAVQNCQVDCIKELIAAGASKNLSNNEALQHIATQSVEFVTKLLDAGIDVNSTGENGNTALMIAVRNSNREIVQLLIDSGAKVNAENDHGETALYLAIVQSHLEFERQQKKEKNKGSWLIIQILLLAGAHMHETKSGLNPNAVDLESPAGGDSFLDTGMFPSIKPLLNYTRDSIREILKENNPDENLYSTVLQLELPSKLKSYLLHHTLRNYNAILNNDEKILLLKTTQSDVETVQHLIATNLDLNVQDENGMTALMIASQNGNLELAEQFIKGANLNIQAFFSDTALIYATRNKQHECVQKLVEHGANTNIQGKDGNTALIHAAKELCEDILNTLLDGGANPIITNDNGSTALTVGANSLKCVQMLIEAGADVNSMDKYGQTALIHAAGFGKVDCVKELLAYGADVNGTTTFTPLMVAALAGHVECVNVLIREGADLNVKIFGLTASTVAGFFGSATCFKTLLQAGGEVCILLHSILPREIMEGKLFLGVQPIFTFGLLSVLIIDRNYLKSNRYK